VIYALVGWRIWRKSREAAIFALALYLAYDCGEWVRFFFGNSQMAEDSLLEGVFGFFIATGLAFGGFGDDKT
jgi:hypothetical protein